MAITNQERVGKAMELLKEGLQPFVEREMKAQHAQRWFEEARDSVSDTQVNLFGTASQPKWDVASILSVIWNQWNLVFKKAFGRAERSLVQELVSTALPVGAGLQPRAKFKQKNSFSIFARG